MLKTLLNLIFPPKCIFCGRILNVTCELEICKECFERIPFTGSCEIETVYGSCYDRIICLCDYSGIIKDVLVGFKFHSKPGCGKTLGTLLADKVAGLAAASKFDLLTCVPLHPKRLRERGYNQSEILCRELGKSTGMPVNTHIIKRIRNTEAQSLLAGKQRYSNVKDAFLVVDAGPVIGKSVLLVDDIMTTGNTLNECARILKDAGAASVTAAVIASGRKY
jgi:competence protein ComFC